MVEAPNKLLDRARAELHTFDRVGKQTASELILALFEAERQIAELRTKLDEYKEVAHNRTAAWTAAEAENARLNEANRKLHRRAQWAEGLLQNASNIAREEIETLESVATKAGHWPAGSHWAKRAMERWLESTLSGSGARPALPLKDERHLSLDEQKTFNDALRKSGTIRQVLPLKDEMERVLDALITDILSYEKINALAPNPGKRYCWQSVENAVALLSRLRAGEQGWRSRAADDVLAERRRQVEAEGWTPEHDNVHSDGQMAVAAACYAKTASMPGIDRAAAHFGTPIGWPWGREWWKPKDRRRDLVRAAALLIAEIERLDRRAVAPSEQGGDRP